MAFPPTHPAFARALSERDYNDPTEVQTAVLAPEAAGRDLLVSAQTGSGKTVAFGLAFGITLLDGNDTLGHASEPLALVIAPTRELALQVERELTWLYQYAGARIVACVGGMDPQAERRALNRGCHIVVGTPGRLRDHLERGALRIANLKAAVLDEADEMLDLGFREDLEFILQAASKERRTLLFSATLPKMIVTLAKQFQNDALRIAASGGQRSHADIEYRVMRVAPQDTEHAVVNVLRFFESPSALVFCNTRETVRHLHAILLERGFAAVSLSGEFSQSERNRALQALRDGKARVCVATDVAARGIDLPSLNLVIHADVPNDAETLQHRSGRTGRAGRKGVSVLLVPPSRRRRAEQMLGVMKVQAIWKNPPTAEEISKLDDERLLQNLLQVEAGQPDDMALAKKLLEQRSPEDIAAILVRMHRAQLPAPEDIADQGPAPQGDARDSYGKQPPWKKAHDGGDRPPRDGGRDSFREDSGPMVWFRLNVGRAKKADPKWLIPEICRQGGITKREIGNIKIFDDETKFEVAEHIAEKFTESAAKVTKGDIRISTTTAPSAGSSTRGTAKKPFVKPYANAGKKHWQKKPGDKPFQKRDDKPGKDFKPSKDFKKKHRKGPSPK